MRRLYFCLAASLSLGLLSAFGPDLFSSTQQDGGADAGIASKNVASKIARVTVYPNSALVTREVEVPAGSGLAELVVTPLPDQIVASTMYSEGADGVRVLTTRFRTRQVLEDTSEERRKLESDLETLQVAGAKIDSELASIQKNMQLLGKLENFTDKTAVMSTEKGGLNGDTVITLAKYVMEQRVDKAKEVVALTEQKRQNQIQLKFLQRKRVELGQGSGRMERDAVIVVDRTGTKAGKIRLNYLVAAVRWHPEYKLRAGKVEEDVQLDYLANLMQQTGEDWHQVHVTLSTAQPMLNAAPPELAALQPVLVARAAIGLPPIEGGFAGKSARKKGGKAGPGQDFRATPPADAAFVPKEPTKALEDRANLLRQQALDVGNGVFNEQAQAKAGDGKAGQPGQAGVPGMQGQGYMNNFDANKDVNRFLNDASAYEQQMELMRSRDEIVAANKKVFQPGVGNEGPSVTYHLPNKLTVPSRNDEQIIEVAKLKMTPKYYYKAVPVLNRHVYRLADLLNKSDQVLLPGEATMYQGTDFVGRMTLPLVAIGEEFTAGFGVDPQVQIQRKLMDQSRTMQGGNQVLKYEYQILVSSFKSEPVKLHVWDRLPQGETESVGVSIVKTSPELSKDAIYLRESRPNNLLRWDLDVAANRNGEKAVTISYEFRMELDRQMAISGFQSK